MGLVGLILVVAIFGAEKISGKHDDGTKVLWFVGLCVAVLVGLIVLMGLLGGIRSS